MKIDADNKFWRRAAIASIIFNLGFSAFMLYRGWINSSYYVRYRHYVHGITHKEPPQRYLGYQTFEEFEKSFNGDQGAVTPIHRIEAAVLCLGIGHEDPDIYGDREFWASPEVVWEKAEDDCDGGAMMGVHLLRLQGFESNFLALRKQQVAHAVAYFKDEDGKFGAISIAPSEFRSPKFESLNDLVKSLEYDEYSVIDPEDLDPNWIRTKRNLRPEPADFSFTKVK